jgi:hypothetical protein
MRAWLIKEGVEGHAVKFEGLVSTPKIEKKVIKEEVMYFEEDVEIDPVGKFGCGPNQKSIGGDWARKGYYGFKLPENKSGYKLILIHSNDIEIG